MRVFRKKSEASPNWWLRGSKISRAFVTVLALVGTPVLMLIFQPTLVPFVLAGWWGLWWWWWQFSVKFDDFEKERIDASKDAQE